MTTAVLHAEHGGLSPFAQRAIIFVISMCLSTSLTCLLGLVSR